MIPRMNFKSLGRIRRNLELIPECLIWILRNIGWFKDIKSEFDSVLSSWTNASVNSGIIIGHILFIIINNNIYRWLDFLISLIKFNGFIKITSDFLSLNIESCPIPQFFPQLFLSITGFLYNFFRKMRINLLIFSLELNRQWQKQQICIWSGSILIYQI